MRLRRRIAQPPSTALSAPESKLTSGTGRDNDAPPQRRVPRQLDKVNERTPRHGCLLLLWGRSFVVMVLCGPLQQQASVSLTVTSNSFLPPSQSIGYADARCGIGGTELAMHRQLC
jgi:hypothetical protein